MSESVKTCGEALLQLLADYGIECIFGIPGVHTLELYRGLKDAPLRHVQPRHEQGAAFMADGYARSTGKPAACFLITGPGLANALTGIGQAYSDSVPMLVISSVNDKPSLNKHWGRLHEIPHQRQITASLTAFSATAMSAEELPHLLHRAFTVFSSQRPRPVHIEIPTDVLAQDVHGKWYKQKLPDRPQVAAEQTQAAAKLLVESQNSVMVVGGGCRDASEEIVAVAERLNAQIITTIAGKGLVPPTHELNQGSCLYTKAGVEKVLSADTVLAVATEFAETDTISTSPLRPAGTLIRVDIDARELCDDHPADLPLLGDAKRFLQDLLTQLPNINGAESVHKMKAAKIIDNARNDCNALTKKHLVVLDALSATLPHNTVVATDMTQIVYTGNVFYPAPLPNSWLYPAGFGTLGYALPAAIGAKLAQPENHTVALIGDGGFMFSLPELACAVEHQLPIAIVLWNNSAYGQIRDDMQAAEIALVGVLPQNPNFQQVVTGFGCHYSCPASVDEFCTALNNSFTRTGPTVIEVIDGSEWLNA